MAIGGPRAQLGCVGKSEDFLNSIGLVFDGGDEVW